jgi:hypothetical protein
MVRAQSHPQHNRRPKKMAVDEVGLHLVNETTDLMEQARQTPRRLDRKIDRQSVQKGTCFMPTLDEAPRKSWQRDMNLNAMSHQLAHLVNGPSGAIDCLDNVQNTHH